MNERTRKQVTDAVYRRTLGYEIDGLHGDTVTRGRPRSSDQLASHPGRISEVPS
ncbi:hypothetical protein U1Q18_027141, partial [Sarracenia purpurea var. burkii]